MRISAQSVPEFSECLFHDRDGTIVLEWTRRGYRRCVLVADELIEQWVADLNELRSLRARVGDG